MDIVLRATVMFAILFLLLRLLGKRELGQMRRSSSSSSSSWVT